jgi:hypothetical protein
MQAGGAQLPPGRQVNYGATVTQVPDFATKPTLAGERVILRPYIDADLPALREAMADPDLLRLTGSIHDEAETLEPVSPEEEQLRLDWFNTRNDQDDRLDLAIVDKASGGCVGEAVLNLQPARPPRLREGRLPRRGSAPRVAPLRRPVDRRDRDVHPCPRMAPGHRNPGIMDRCLHRGVHNGPSWAHHPCDCKITARSAERAARAGGVVGVVGSIAAVRESLRRWNTHAAASADNL